MLYIYPKSQQVKDLTSEQKQNPEINRKEVD